MILDLADDDIVERSRAAAWQVPERYWSSLNQATMACRAPVVAIQVDALLSNAHDMVRRAGGLPIRVATKSIRVRSILDAVLALPGYDGLLAFSLTEAVWLAEAFDNIVVAYPSVDRHAIQALVTSEEAAKHVTIMIDSVEHLDAVDAVAPPETRPSVRVCIDIDASWRSPVFGHIGVLRSPIHTAQDARTLAETVAKRQGFELVGVMAYEAQIAGVGNAPAGRPLRGTLLREIQRQSAAELRQRRALAVEQIRGVSELEFVNGGGSGSIESTASESVVTEIGAGSGLFGPHLFDHYAHFSPAPAAAFALDVVRKASPETATLFGGGWTASGVHGADRLPQIAWPAGLRFAAREGAGEVQTPVLGHAARNLSIGDRVWLRHTKSGEVMEHANEVALVTGDRLLGTVPTYRGEGKALV